MKKKEIDELLGHDIVPLWKRALAYIADILVVNLVIVLPFKTIIKNLSITSDANPFNFLASTSLSSLKPLIYISIVIAILTILYWSMLEYSIQQSIGKILFRIKVMSTNKRKLSFWQCLVRNITKISTIVLLIDSLYMIKSHHLRYFEKISSTKVINT